MKDTKSLVKIMEESLIIKSGHGFFPHEKKVRIQSILEDWTQEDQINELN